MLLFNFIPSWLICNLGNFTANRRLRFGHQSGTRKESLSSCATYEGSQRPRQCFITCKTSSFCIILNVQQQSYPEDFRLLQRLKPLTSNLKSLIQFLTISLEDDYTTPSFRNPKGIRYCCPVNHIWPGSMFGICICEIVLQRPRH